MPLPFSARARKNQPPATTGRPSNQHVSFITAGQLTEEFIDDDADSATTVIDVIIPAGAELGSHSHVIDIFHKPLARAKA